MDNPSNFRRNLKQNAQGVYDARLYDAKEQWGEHWFELPRGNPIILPNTGVRDFGVATATSRGDPPPCNKLVTYGEIMPVIAGSVAYVSDAQQYCTVSFSSAWNTTNNVWTRRCSFAGAFDNSPGYAIFVPNVSGVYDIMFNGFAVDPGGSRLTYVSATLGYWTGAAWATATQIGRVAIASAAVGQLPVLYRTVYPLTAGTQYIILIYGTATVNPLTVNIYFPNVSYRFLYN